MAQTALATTPTADPAPVVTIGANFTGAAFHTDPGIAVSPPDTDGAAGPTSFVELLNNLYRVYDKSGALLQFTRLPEFWTSAGVTLDGQPFDPRILYDPVSERWFATSSENPFIPNDILLAVSRTSDPTPSLAGFCDSQRSCQVDLGRLPDARRRPGRRLHCRQHVLRRHPRLRVGGDHRHSEVGPVAGGSDRGECDGVHRCQSLRHRLLPASSRCLSAVGFGAAAFPRAPVSASPAR